MSSTIESVFANNGKLSVQPGYMMRLGQVAMAKDVENAMATKRNLIVEAGTGTGKTYAYLVPIMLSKRKAIISTDSLALQDQLFNKDIKKLEEILQTSVDVQILKGFANYICMKNLFYVINKSSSELNSESNGIPTDLFGDDDTQNVEKAAKNHRNIFDLDKNQKFAITEFLQKTKLGEIAEFKKIFELNAAEWDDALIQKVTTSMERCAGRNCPNCKECFFMKAREKAKNADILIVNHALFCCGAKSPTALFPNVDACIIDEAHKLPDRVRSSFSTQFSKKGFEELLVQVFDTLTKDVYEVKTSKDEKNSSEAGLSAKRFNGRLVFKSDAIKGRFDQAKAVCESFRYPLDRVMSGINNINTDDFFHIKENVNAKDVTTRVRDGASESDFIENLNKNQLMTSIYGLIDPLIHLCNFLQDEVNFTENAEKKAIVTRLLENIREVGAFIKRYVPELWKKNFTEDNYYRWYEFSQENFTFTLTPISPADEFNRLVLNSERFAQTAFVFTSATLATSNAGSANEVERIERDNYAAFQDYSAMLGLHKADTDVLLVDSPFDYQGRSLLCVPDALPDKVNPDKMIDFLATTINKTPGGIFILSTSNSGVNNIADAVKNCLKLNKRLLLVQRKNVDRNALIEKFKKDGKAILVGTKSFWEGVDVQGKALSMVIIDKLPFPQKSIQLKAEENYYLKVTHSESKPFKAFMGVDLPKAIIDLKQGVGRLLRSESDRGVVILCAPTLTVNRAKSYRDTILGALPSFKVTESLNDINEFWKKFD
jgi:ATP-dependent DNA helicase DinG